MFSKLLVVLIAVALAGFLYPLLNEQTGSPCAAVERRFVKLIVANGDAGDLLGAVADKEARGIGNGSTAEAIARQRKPGLATFATCYGYYWYSFYDKKWLLEFGITGFAK